jgi:hypothetical protein
MQHVKMLADVVDVARRAADRWYVTVGHAAVGPVNLDLLARGVEAGKVPLGAFVRHEQWKVWRPLVELAVFEEGEGDDLRPRESTDDVSEPGRLSAPADSSVGARADAGPDSEASARRDALLLLLTAAVARGGADVAIVHEIDDEGAVAVCVHGPSRWEALGVRTPLLDPALAAAATGATVVVAGQPDPAGASVVSRLSRVAGGFPPTVDGALLIPIRAGDHLVAMLELGRRTPFLPPEIASLEALVASVADQLHR